MSDGDADLHRGLPMVAAWEPEALARERAELAALETKGLGARLWGYAKRTGPGWMQSALTLGSGSFFSSFFAGAMLGYALIWAQPLGMLLGVVMFAAIAHQTLSTGVRPFDAMRRFVHPAFAWAWALGSLVSTVFWHFAQYSCAGTVCADLAEFAGWQGAGGNVGARVLFGVVILAVSIAVTWLYGSGRRGIRLYDKLIKAMVALIIAAFLLVVIRTGVDWAALWRGIRGVPGNVLGHPSGLTLMMAGLSAAVGINMTFLFPYTLLARGWGREHRGLAKFDLAAGMWLPFTLAVSLLLIAAANTMYDPASPVTGGVPPQRAAQVLSAAAGPVVGRVVFDVGVLGMCLSSITLHMLVCAFTFCEVLGLEPTGWRYRLGALIPVPGVLGTVVWAKFPFWLPIVAAIFSLMLLPIAYIGFFVLHNRRAYLGDAKPTGWRAVAWNAAMLVAIAVVTGGGITYIIKVAIPRLFG